MRERVRVAVAGASGYTGAETLRWLLGHPAVEVVGATAQKHAGKALSDLWPQFHGHDLRLAGELPEADVYFLCLPHGEAAKLAPSLAAECIIDLSGDHRLPEPQHSQHYGFARESEPWVYGLPELGFDRCLGAPRIANPGCFATALSLALLPLRGKMSGRVAAVGVTGSTGSGATPSDTTHHPLRAENLRSYKVLGHQHVPEVEAAIGDIRLDFVPMSGPFRRGILVTFTLPAVPARLWETFYQSNPLVRVLRKPPELAHVVGSARADIGVIEGDGVTVVQCAIDNLGRGAGSQAVANLNLRMGWPMHLGLDRIGAVP
ncbi:N-acetyl-gamma-glutamyl-phosphate reductase [Deltaproteobacteria bacterium]|nr:N-acetyl-gamma-glutamyl-phosphate reductase [Deltaproteobacteria bacterium]